MKEPSIETPHTLFSLTARFFAPVFQRLYVWGEQELDELIGDILSEETVSTRFLGAIVLKELGRQKGPTSPMSYLMIDGQQRLTTLYMLLAALAREAENCNAVDISTFITKEYLIESKSPAFFGQPKLIPTLQDRSTLWENLELALPNTEWDFKSDAGDSKSAAKLEAQWNRILVRVEALVRDASGRFKKKQMDSFLEHLQNKLNFIVITLDEEDDANLIFSKLNATGVPLALADLVRNEVFSKFGSKNGRQAERFYEQHWHPFERSFTRLGDLNAFFPIYSYIAFQGSITKAGAFPELQKRWLKHSPQKILDSLLVYSPFYQALTSGKPIEGFDNDLNRMIDRFSRMPRTTVTWPYILQVLASAVDKQQQKRAVACLKIIESFLVRRAIAGIEPTGLHAVFKGLWQHAKTDTEEVRKRIVTRTIRVPTDDELEIVVQSEALDTRVILPYLLQEMERDTRDVKKYDGITDTVLTIEHVMPRKTGGEWPVPNDDSLIGLIGNLVPLSESQNKSLKDQGWPEKRERFVGSNFVITQQLARKQKWDEASIRSRSTNISKWIKQRWPAHY